MKRFLGNDWLLDSDVAMQLYYDHAQKMPIIDYHCHLPPKEIAYDQSFENITKIWLDGDHYKWRAMRANGISEKYITGNASDFEKFAAWAETVPQTLRNPLYHWTHLELSRYFGIEELLNKKSAEAIYASTKTALAKKELSVQGILNKMNVKLVGTTDDPIDNLEFHIQIKQQNLSTQVTPSFRPDKSFDFSNLEAYNQYIDKLSVVSGIEIKHLDDLIEALHARIDFFDSLGCKSSDHGLNQIPFKLTDLATLKSNFEKVRACQTISFTATEELRTYILLELSKSYHSKNWAQQFHLGALRNTNRRALRELGPDTGFDSIGDFDQAQSLSKFLDELNNTNQLTRTILYNLNPRDNEMMATMMGNYNDESIAGKMQFGSAWWFLDQKTGMTAQINALSNLGLLSRFIGMLTDSRSFLSFPRHEYFRRILCNIIAHDVVQGEIPHDMDQLGHMIENICYNNAKNYFNIV